MPIQFPTPPMTLTEASGEGRLTAALRRVRAPGGAPEAEPLPPLPVFPVGLDELLEADAGAERSVTQRPSWRYTRFGSNGQPEVLELMDEQAAGAVATGNDRFSPFIREALATADQDPRAREHDYEARLLRIPALTLLALWLHAPTGVDLFVPLGRAIAGVEQRVYDDREFMSAIRRAAESKRGAYSQAENPDELGS